MYEKKAKVLRKAGNTFSVAPTCHIVWVESRVPSPVMGTMRYAEQSLILVRIRFVDGSTLLFLLNPMPGDARQRNGRDRPNLQLSSLHEVGRFLRLYSSSLRKGRLDCGWFGPSRPRLAAFQVLLCELAVNNTGASASWVTETAGIPAMMPFPRDIRGAILKPTGRR